MNQDSGAGRTAGSLRRGVGLLPETAEVLQKEILYHRGRRGHSGKTPDWEIGFIDGLYHAHDLVQKISRQSNDPKLSHGHGRLAHDCNLDSQSS